MAAEFDFDLLVELPIDLVPYILALHGNTELLVQHFVTYWGWQSGDHDEELPCHIDPNHIAMCLIRKYGGDKENALIYACRANAPASAIKAILESSDASEAPRADCQDGYALVRAAEAGHTDVVRLLLERPDDAPRADCRYGEALVWAAEEGHLAVVRLLLEWPVNAPRADCQDGEALARATQGGHTDVVRLLQWR